MAAATAATAATAAASTRPENETRQRCFIPFNTGGPQGVGNEWEGGGWEMGVPRQRPPAAPAGGFLGKFGNAPVMVVTS